MALITPERPNTHFYHLLDSFLNNNLFGHLLPDYSEVFSFKAKVTFYLSLILIPIQTLLTVIWTYYKVGRDGVEDMRKNFIDIIDSNDKNMSIKLLPLLIFSFVAMVITPFYTYINPPEMNTLERAKGYNEIFYGNIIPYTVETIIFQPLAVFFFLPCIFFAATSTYKRLLSYFRK